MRNTILSFLVVVVISGCATVEKAPPKVEAPVSRATQVTAQQQQSAPTQRLLKRKVAVGRFTNETNYGKTLLRDQSNDPLGKQAADMLSTRLIDSEKFLVFERPDLDRIQQEQLLSGVSNLVGVDALIVGSVTEFGRATEGKTGFLSGTKKQIARAKVEARLVDIRTGLAFFSASGVGEATSESGEIAGYGSKAAYDATLNDRAIGAAVSDLLSSIVAKLGERPWRTSILAIEGGQVFVSGGQQQGIQIGDKFKVMRRGKVVKSPQTGFEIELPGTETARGTVISTFGDSAQNEGCILRIDTGSLNDVAIPDLFIVE